MGNNLLWLIQEKYPDKKIIVWAANFHITKNNSWLEEINAFAESLVEGTAIHSGTVEEASAVMKLV